MEHDADGRNECVLLDLDFRPLYEVGFSPKVPYRPHGIRHRSRMEHLDANSRALENTFRCICNRVDSTSLFLSIREIETDVWASGNVEGNRHELRASLGER